MNEMVLKKKMCMIGDGAVGKTSLIRRFVYNEFDDKYITTMGANVSKRVIDLTDLGEKYADYQAKITLSIWDILGQRSYLRLRPMYYMGADGALVVCDVTQRESMTGLSEWINSLFTITGAIPIIILCNKMDLIDESTFQEEELETVADRFNTQYYYTSAKTGEKVEDAFYELGRLMAVNTILFDAISTSKEVGAAIIDGFCRSHGGHEHAMPYVRHQMEQIDINIEAPTAPELRQLTQSLVELTESMKGTDAAKYERQRFRKLLSRL